MTRIRDVKVTSVSVPLTAPRTHSLGTTAAVRRHIIEVLTDDGLVGLGEAGTRTTAEALGNLGQRLLGRDPFTAVAVVRGERSDRYPALARRVQDAGIELALLDLQGQVAGRPVSDLLGARSRDEIATTAYLFRREGDDADTSTDATLAEAEALVEQHGFGTLKFKGGSLGWQDDVATTCALRERFTTHLLRLDPNAVWSLPNALRAAERLAAADLEWLEDPTSGLGPMAQLTSRAGMPMATNMCLTYLMELPEAAARHSTDVVLIDPWFTGGLGPASVFAQACAAFGFGLGLHSGGGGTTELGIATAAMLHLAASLPALPHAMDSRYHDLTGDVLTEPHQYGPGGTFPIPSSAGLGVSLDRDQLTRYQTAETLSVSEWS